MKTMTNSWFSPANASKRFMSIRSKLRQAGGQPPVLALVVGAPDLAVARRVFDLRGLVDEVDLHHLHQRAVFLRFAAVHRVAGHLDVLQPVLLFARQHQALARGRIDDLPGHVPVAPAHGISVLGDHVDLRMRSAGAGRKQQHEGSEQRGEVFAHGAHYARFNAKRAVSVATGLPSPATTRARIATRARPRSPRQRRMAGQSSPSARVATLCKSPYSGAK